MVETDIPTLHKSIDPSRVGHLVGRGKMASRPAQRTLGGAVNASPQSWGGIGGQLGVAEEWSDQVDPQERFVRHAELFWK